MHWFLEISHEAQFWCVIFAGWFTITAVIIIDELVDWIKHRVWDKKHPNLARKNRRDQKWNES